MILSSDETVCSIKLYNMNQDDFRKAVLNITERWSTVSVFHERVISVGGTSWYSLNILERRLNNNRALNLFFQTVKLCNFCIFFFFCTCKSRSRDLQLVIIADRRLLIVLNIILLLCNNIRYPTNRVWHKIIHIC